MIGDLNSARQREKAEMAVFITLEKSKKPMLDEATAAGFYRPPEQPNHRIPRMQILTIEDLLVGGKQPELPRLAQMQTFKKPPRVYKGKPAEQAGLFEKLRA
jgi:site-specific DNA-methyltransferase (adenine-specific)